MTDIEKLYNLIDKKEKLICMLAPSFAADFDYPEIVWKLRSLGFKKVVELTFGAKLVNIATYEVLKKDKSKTWIASPCPTLVQVIRTKYPHLVDNLVPVHSPMGAMSLVCRRFFPDYKQVFIGPCLTKKNEAVEISGIELALTFKELQQILDERKVVALDNKVTFDKFYNDYTKIYPLAGGMAETIHYQNILKDEEVLSMDGIGGILKILDEFKNGKYKDYVFLDFLSCNGGCIGGLGMYGNYSLDERKNRILKYRDFAINKEKDLGRQGKIIHAEGIDFSRKY